MTDDLVYGGWAALVLLFVIVQLWKLFEQGKRMRPVEEAIERLVSHKDGLPLLRMIASGEVRWRTRGPTADSLDGLISIDKDIYFYMYVRWRGNRYNVDNLAPHHMASMLTCAAFNQSRVSRATDDYTAYLEKMQ